MLLLIGGVGAGLKLSLSEPPLGAVVSVEIGARVGPLVGLLDGEAGDEVGKAADVGSTIPA